MEDEIDLRIYIAMLVRHWRLIVALTLLAGAIALVVSWLLPTEYQATAVVVVTRPLYQFQFSSDIQNLPESVQQSLTGKAALDLATSDAVLEQVLRQVGDELPPKERNLVSLRGSLTAKNGGDPSIVDLSVTNRDPQRVARIANMWASLYVRQVNDLYGQSADQLKFFESQLTQAKGDLDSAEQALVDFQNRNDSAVFQAQLTAKQGALSSYLTMNESLILLQQNVKNLQDQLARRPADAPSNLGEDLSQLMFQVSAFNELSSSIPIQLQVVGTGSLSNRTVGQQVADLAGLAKTIETKQGEVKKQAEALPAEIKGLQGQIQEARTKETRLTRQRDLAQTVYTTLAQKVQETRIAAQETSGRVRLASSAAVPERPLSKKLLMYAVLGVTLGFIVAVIGAFVLDSFHELPRTHVQQPPEQRT